MRRLDLTIIEAIQAATGTMAEIAARFGVSMRSIARIRPTKKDRLTDDQIIDAFTSTESDRDVATRLKVSVDLITAIRSRRAHSAITADLPERPRGRVVYRPRAEIEAERATRIERRASLDRRRELILTSREPHSKIAQQLGIDRSVVFRIRRAAGWVADPKPARMVTVRPVKAEPRGVRATPGPKPKPPKQPKPLKPPKAEPRIVEWKPALSTPPVLQPKPEPPKVDVRATLKQFISGHPLLSILALGRHLDLRLPWLSIINAMALPGSSPAPRSPKQVRRAVRLKPGYLRSRDPRAIVCRFYSVGDRPEATGLGDPL